MRSSKERFVEIYGSSLMMSRYLRIAVLCLGAACVALAVVNVRTYQTFSRFKPLVVRISDVGRAEAVTYDSMEYRPRDAEIRYFLIDFVTKHYGRMRATVRENFARSLFFLDGRLADATIEANKKNKTIESFIAGQGPEVEIAVRNVAIEDLRTSPIRASVDFDKVYYAAGDHVESKRERYSAHFVFIVRERVPNAFIPVNPLGLTITYFREDQAFQ
jgi:type IV secretory pathway TrbF-like protein